MLIWLILIFLAPLSSAQQQKSDCSYTPEVNERFGSDYLSTACERKLNWLSTAFSGVGKSLSDIMDDSQLQYFNKIQTCDFNCICSAFDWCKDLLKGVEVLLTVELLSFLIIIGWSFKAGIDAVKNISSINGIEGGITGLKNATDNLNIFDGLNKDKKDKDKDKNKPKPNDNGIGGNNFLGNLGKIGKRQAPNNGPPIKPAVRKEYRMMSDLERQKFHYALNKLKTTRLGSKSQYDIMIVYHTPEYSPGAHFGAAFLPFHRQFLKLLEVSMRLYEPDVGIPYWDSTLEELLPNPSDSVIWSEEFMGSSQGVLSNGPFANWTVYPNTKFTLTPRGGKIVRNIGRSNLGSLYKQKDIDVLMTKPSFKQLTFCNDPYTELVHGAVHIWIGGHMQELEISPNDPAFFILHSFVDFLWEQWRQEKQTRFQRENDYTIDTQSCNNFHTGGAQMKPFTILNRDGLSNNYTDKNYNYAPRPTCDLPNCGSPYLFCDTRARRCVSKVVLGGNCLGFEQFDICYKSICQRGRCVPGAPLISQMTSPTTTPTTTTTRPTTTTTKKTTATTTSTTRSTTKTTAESLTIPDSFFSQATTTEAKTSEITTVAETTSDTATNSTISTTDSFTTESPTLKTAETSTEETTTTAGNKTSSTEISSTTSKSPEITTVTTTESATAAVGSQDIFPDTLWIPVTIVKANGLLASKVPEAKLTSKDAKSGKILEGAVQTRNEYPYYEGIAFAPVESPAKTGHSETLITAMDGDGKKCKSLCYQGKTNVHAYELCDGHIHLDVDRSKSDSLAYTPAKDQTPFLSWDGPVRRPNFLLFVCNADDEEPQRLKDAVANITGLTSAGSTAQENSVTAEFTLPPATTTTSQKPFNDKEGCINRHRCCSIWSEAGECERNPTWMKVSCEKSCQVCRAANTSDSNCQDIFSKCSKWYSNGECKKNPAWMEENCPSACSICQRKLDELKPLCGEPLIQECTNFNEKCAKWAKKGECKTNEWWMSHNCPLACGKCTL